MIFSDLLLRLLGFYGQTLFLGSLESSIFLPVLRDLTELKAEHARLSGSLLTCCLRLTLRAQSRDSSGSGRSDESEPAQLLLLVAKTQALEKEAHEKSQELMQLKSQGDLEKAELQDRWVSWVQEESLRESWLLEGCEWAEKMSNTPLPWEEGKCAVWVQWPSWSVTVTGYLASSLFLLVCNVNCSLWQQSPCSHTVEIVMSSCIPALPWNASLLPTVPCPLT